MATITSDTSISLRNDEWHLIASALEAEIEHSNDYCKEMDYSDEDGRQAIINERKRGAALEAMREYILSATYVPSGDR